ncbi:unnamed protein product [Symbiodinium microadriaticum]|nr:unnamed protein product [Symbiodinium microadriaticum]
MPGEPPEILLVQHPNGALAQACLPDYIATPPPETPPELAASAALRDAWRQSEEASENVVAARRVLFCILLASFFVEVALAARRAPQPQFTFMGVAIDAAAPPRNALVADILFGALYYCAGLQAIAPPRLQCPGSARDGLTLDVYRRHEQLQRFHGGARRFAKVALLAAFVQPALAIIAGPNVLGGEASLMFLRAAAYSQATTCLIDAQRALAATRALAEQFPFIREPPT